MRPELLKACTNGRCAIVTTPCAKFIRRRCPLAVLSEWVPKTHDHELRAAERAADRAAGVDVAFDATGHGALPDLIELTGDPDNVITIADYSAPRYGVRVSGGQEGRSYQALGQAAQLFTDGTFSMPVAETLSNEEAPRAHWTSQDGHVRGKVLLTVS